MIETIDLERLKMTSLTHLTQQQIKRLTNAENACKNSMSDWAKDYWFNIFQTLCKKYGVMDYFRKVIH